MELQWHFFSKPRELIDYVNQHKIRRENIQDIITTNYDGWVLFYWE